LNFNAKKREKGRGGRFFVHKTAKDSRGKEVISGEDGEKNQTNTATATIRSETTRKGRTQQLGHAKR